MTAESLPLFYEEPERTAAPVRERRYPRDFAPDPVKRTPPPEPVPPTPAPAPDLEPGDLAAWTDEGGCSHVGRVESVEEDAATLTYGPRPHRARIDLDELRAVADKDGRGNLR